MCTLVNDNPCDALRTQQTMLCARFPCDVTATLSARARGDFTRRRTRHVIVPRRMRRTVRRSRLRDAIYDVDDGDDDATEACADHTLRVIIAYISSVFRERVV